MQRRTFLSTVAAATLASGAGELTSEVRATSTVPELSVESSSSLLDASGGLLTDDSYVAVRAESTAYNADADGNGDAVDYGDTPIPVVAADGDVVGIGCTLVEDGTNWQRGNEEFLLNVWDAHAGSGTVLWDESHSQYYTLSKFAEFEAYAENNGYTVQASSDLSADLPSADAVVVTSPSDSFTNQELKDLSQFVQNGGAVLLHDQSDYSGYDETASLDEVTAELGVAFRFNDDQVLDDIQNDGSDYQSVTTNFNTAFPYFSDRTGLGYDPTATYTVPVTEVLDGDTVKADFDGTTENVRILGLDTPEKSSNSQYERVQEWEGIESNTYLEGYADQATQYANDRLANETIDVTFDENSAVRDAFGRLLGYVHYDATGDGSRDTFYNREIVADGLARVYDGDTTTHDDFLAAEDTARANATNVWTDSDPDGSSEIRDNPVDDLFFPVGASVRTSSGGVADSRVPVFAEPEAGQQLDGGYDYSGDIPLVALDEPNNVAVLGAPLIDESYESEEGYAVDTSTYENYVFLTNVLDALSSRSGDVRIVGGHGEFGASYALTAEDAAYYMRYLEGQDVGFQGVNDLASADLSGDRAVVVTAPERAYTQAELDALSAFTADGGAVILLGSGKPLPAARDNLNAVASALGTDLRVNADQVVDSTNNVNSDSEVPATANFDTTFDLFDPFTADGGSSGDAVEITTVHADASGDDTTNLNDEYVVFENTGSSGVDLTDWQVTDEAGKTYAFPSFTLDSGASVTLHTGSGADSSTDLYWGRGSPVWNNDGDTATLYDASGATVDTYSYPQSSSSGDLAVKTVHADASGNDGDNLNDEYVVFENTGSGSLDVTNWQVQDEVEKTYTFPSFTLDAGAAVTLHTGSGSDTSTDLYWGRSSPVWNNSGDTVYVYDDTGSLVLEHPY